MEARARLSLPIATTVEIKVEVELQLWSICQQIFKKELDFNSKRALYLWMIFDSTHIMYYELHRALVLLLIGDVFPILLLLMLLY